MFDRVLYMPLIYPQLTALIFRLMLCLRSRRKKLTKDLKKKKKDKSRKLWYLLCRNFWKGDLCLGCLLIQFWDCPNTSYFPSLASFWLCEETGVQSLSYQMSGPVIFVTNQTCTENGHSNWPKYYDQHCPAKFNLHFTSFIMIRISENDLTLDQNSIKTKLRAFEIQFLAQTKHAKYWLQTNAEPGTCHNSFTLYFH